MPQMRLIRDCEQGVKGQLFNISDESVTKILATGNFEYADAPLVEDGAPVEALPAEVVVVEPVRAATEKPRPVRAPKASKPKRGTKR